MNNTKLLTTANMQTSSRLKTHRFLQRLRSSARVLLAVSALAVLAVPYRAAAGGYPNTARMSFSMVPPPGNFIPYQPLRAHTSPYQPLRALTTPSDPKFEL